MSYPTPEEFVRALVEVEGIGQAVLEIKETISAEIETADEPRVVRRMTLTLVADPTYYDDDVAVQNVANITMSLDRRIIAIDTYDHQPYWAVAAVRKVRDEWPI